MSLKNSYRDVVKRVKSHFKNHQKTSKKMVSKEPATRCYPVWHSACLATKELEQGVS